MVDADPVAGLFRGSKVLRLQAGKRRTTRVYVEDDPADREKHQHPPEHQLSVRPLAEPARTPPAEVAHALLPAFNVTTFTTATPVTEDFCCGERHY